MPIEETTDVLAQQGQERPDGGAEQDAPRRLGVEDFPEDFPEGPTREAAAQVLGVEDFPDSPGMQAMEETVDEGERGFFESIRDGFETMRAAEEALQLERRTFGPRLIADPIGTVGREARRAKAQVMAGARGVGEVVAAALRLKPIAGKAGVDFVRALGRTAEVDRIKRNPHSSGEARKRAADLLRENREIKMEVPSESTLFQAGQDLSATLDEIFPQDPEFQDEFLTKLVGALPNYAAIVGSTKVLGPAGPALVGSALISDSEFTRALDQGADEDKAMQVWMANLPLGATAAIPVTRIMSRTDQVTRGGVREVLKQGFQGTVDEIIQETFQNTMTNLAAREIYDETRELFEGTFDAMAIAGTLGGTLGAGRTALRGRAQSVNDLTEAAEVADAARVLDQFNEIEFLSRPEVAEFLGDTKVVDSSGLPRRVAIVDRGTTRLQRFGDSLGFTFAAPQVVKASAGEGEVVAEGYLRAENVLEFEQAPHEMTPEAIREQLANERKELELQNVLAEVEGSSASDVRQALLSQGFDTVIMPGEGGRSEFIALTRDQFARAPDSPGFLETVLEQMPATAIKDVVREGDRTFNLNDKNEPTRVANLLKKWAPPHALGEGARRVHLARMSLGARDVVTVSGRSRMLMNDLLEFYGVREPGSKPITTTKALQEGTLNQVPQRTWDLIRSTLEGELSLNQLGDVLTPEIANHVREMRLHTDRLSRKLERIGAIPESLKLEVHKNLGTYITRSFKARDPEIEFSREDVSPEVLTKAKNFIRNQLAERGIDVSDRQVDRMIDNLIEGEVDPLHRMGFVDGAHTKVLHRRKDLPEVIRDLLGEEKNPLRNYLQSTSKLSKAAHDLEFFEHLAVEGDGQGVWDAIAENRPAGTTLIPNKSVYGALAGKATYPEFKEALAHMIDTRSDWSNGFMSAVVTLNASAKMSKTLLNHITHGRNIIGSGFWMIKDGVIPGHNLGAPIKAVKDLVFGPDGEAGLQFLERAAELGMLGPGARAGDTRQALRFMKEGSGITFDSNVANWGWASSVNPAKSRFDAGLQTIQRLYAAEDTAARLSVWAYEQQVLREAFPEWSQDRVEVEAADIARRTFQDYSQLPAAIQQLSAFPVAGAFASFGYEVLRTYANSAQQAINEISSGNEVLQKRGWRRVAGLASVLGLDFAASSAALAAYNFAPEDLEDLRSFVADWNKDSWLIPTAPLGDDMVFRFIDPSYYNPFSMVGDATVGPLIRAAHKAQQGQDVNLSDFNEAMQRNLIMFQEAFLGEEIFAKAGIEAIENRDLDNNRPLTQETDVWRNTATRLLHVLEAFEPGTLTEARNLGYSFTGVTRDEVTGGFIPPQWESVYGVGDFEAMLGMMGLRVIEVPIQESLSFNLSDINREISDVRSLITEPVRRRGEEREHRLGEPLEQRALRLQGRYEEAIMEGHELVEKAMRVGLSQPQVLSTMEDVGMSERLRDEILFGRPSIPLLVE